MSLENNSPLQITSIICLYWPRFMKAMPNKLNTQLHFFIIAKLPSTSKAFERITIVHHVKME